MSPGILAHHELTSHSGGIEWWNVTVLAVHLLAAAAIVLSVAGLTWSSQRIRRTVDQLARRDMERARRRILAVAWVALGVIAASGIVNHFRNVAFSLPHPWAFDTIDVPYGRGYAMLLLSKHVLAAQLVIGLAIVTWASAPRRHSAASELGISIVSGLALGAAIFALVVAAVVGRVHVVIHSAGG